MEADFRNKWNQENQPYTLDYALKPYRTRIAALSTLEEKLKGLSLSAPLPKAADIGLNLVESDHFYFNFWLLTGPFKSGKFPGFSYSEDPQTNHPPKPGDFAQYQGQQFRWMKYNTDNGGIVNKFKQTAADTYVFAFCTITTEEARQMPALVGNNSAVALFCNDKQVAASERETVQHQALPKETIYNLSLKAGTNYILLKVKSGAAGAAFTFRLDTTEPVTNHKHKYTINANQNSHEAD